tara:strand:+ start:278 stop:562 length:285 start_codon:yes stop_codon:yes gene_type:complete
MKRNYLKRLNFKKLEKQNLILKIINNNKIISLEKRTEYSKIRHIYGKNSSITLIRNNCIKTGRNTGTISNYALSRLEFKKQSTKGLLPGIRKSS